MKTVSRDQVAAAAGVSSATVSRVYNNPSSVSPEKQEAVLQAAENLGYTPNKTASALRRNGTGIITLIEIKKEKREYYWADFSLFKWFYSEVLHAVKDVVDNSMFQLNLATVEGSQDLKKLRSKSDGIICYDVDRHEEAEMIADAGIPYVLGHHTKDYKGHPRCSTDNEAGGILQAQLLVEAGCKHPAYITAHTDEVKPNRDRMNGFLSVYGKDNVKIVESRVGREAGFKAAEKILPSVKNRSIDGIAAVNDLTAAGAGYAIEAAGIKIYTELPLAGYDNMPFRAVLPFPLLTVDLKPSEVYRSAAKLLLEQITGQSSYRSRIIQPEKIYPKNF